ncbi:MAG TPA: TolC family protein [Sphingobium sp.]|uniref:TolC family protein n=1 Tax=Sphingobium sp. TaxID=1912891 RepID=UPI002ED5CCE1
MVPLLLASAAGAASRQAVGTGVLGGMIVAASVLLETQAKAELAVLPQTSAQARDPLDILVGCPSSAAFPAARPLSSAGQAASISRGLPSALLLNCPDILEGELDLIAADANIVVASATFFPTASLTGQAAFVNSNLGDLFKGSHQSRSYGGSLSLLIFDWGRRNEQGTG